MITNDVLTYIENEVKRGASHSEIMEALVSAGWQRIEIAEAFRMVAERASPDKAGSPMIEMPIAVGLPKASVGTAPSAFPNGNSAGDFSGKSGEKTGENQENAIENSVIDTSFDLTKNDEPTSEEQKPDHHKLIPILIIFGVLVLGAGAYFFLSPLLKNPSKKIQNIVTVVENTKSVQYSGDYEILAPAGMVFPDKTLISSFGGLENRQTSTTINGSFIGVDDWFDSRSKKNEVKFTNKVSVQNSKTIDFTATSRLISNAFYAKLSESSAVFDSTIANQGANWIRYDGNTNIPNYAYGFFGGVRLYDRGFARELAPLLSEAVPGGTNKLPTGETVVSVKYNDSLVNYFSNVFLASDRLEQSSNIGSKFTIVSFSEVPTGEITFDQNDVIKKAVISFGYKTEEYTLPVRVRFTISYEKFNITPAINIPPLVISYSELVNRKSTTDLPSVLQNFFSDVRTIASVYKGVNEGSYKGVCEKSGVEDEVGTELSIPFVSTKVLASGYDNPICADTATAWSYYTHNSTGYYCTDSRGFSGKVSKQPIGDKCN